MTSDSGKTISPWFATVDMPDFPPLDRDASGDVCVVGGGIAGLTTAYLLSRSGQKVILIEDGPLGGGATGRTTAHLSNALDDRYHRIERMHGEQGSRIAATSHTAAINKIEEIARAEDIDCDFLRLDGYLFEPKSGTLQDLEKERDAARRAGLDVATVDRAPAPFDTGPALRFPNQGQIHPLKYVRGIVEALRRDGCQIHNGTHAVEFEGGNPARVQLKNGKTITARAIVVATNSPVNDRVVMHTKQMPYRTYVVGIEVDRDTVPAILLWDDADPYHYIRLMRGSSEQGTKDLLIVGGEDHKTGQPHDMAAPFGTLERWVRERYPTAGEVHYRWSGQVMEPYDAMGFIGRNPADKGNIFIITGDSGNGMTHGTIGGILCTDLILGRPNPWEPLYDPSRKTPSAAFEYAKENVNVVAQYRDQITGGEVSSTDEIRNGQGAIIRRGLKKVAAYRDDSGILHECSAVCPHLGCIVRWNAVESTWDCPCHGSRFTATGKVVNGPSPVDLNSLE